MLPALLQQGIGGGGGAELLDGPVEMVEVEAKPGEGFVQHPPFPLLQPYALRALLQGYSFQATTF